MSDNNVPVYHKQDSGELVVAITGMLTIASGGSLTATSGATVSLDSPTFTGYQRRSTGSITAAGTAQTNAASLTGDLNFVSGANIDKGVILPIGVDGMDLKVINLGTGTNTLKLYPNTGAAINGGTANAAKVVPGTNGAICACSGGGTSSAWSVITAPFI